MAAKVFQAGSETKKDKRKPHVMVIRKQQQKKDRMEGKSGEFSMKNKYKERVHPPPAIFTYGEGYDRSGWPILRFEISGYVSLRDFIRCVRGVWAPERGKKLSPYAIDSIPSNKETLKLREQYVKDKVVVRSRKKKIRRTAASKKFHQWVKKKEIELRKIHKYETNVRIAEMIYEDYEGDRTKLKSLGINYPREYQVSTIQSILSE